MLEDVGELGFCKKCRTNPNPIANPTPTHCRRIPLQPQPHPTHPQNPNANAQRLRDCLIHSVCDTCDILVTYLRPSSRPRCNLFAISLRPFYDLSRPMCPCATSKRPCFQCVWPFFETFVRLICGPFTTLCDLLRPLCDLLVAATPSTEAARPPRFLSPRLPRLFPILGSQLLSPMAFPRDSPDDPHVCHGISK